ncbi:NAD(P)-binding protein [Poronia punctata]|nr:NAD(P)-binding protein [Poronia punctata]
MVKIVVAGGSGQVAREVIDALIAAKKHDITVFSRSPLPIIAITASEVEWKAVDYNDKATLVEALQGTHTVLSFIQPLADQGQKTQKNLIDAAISAGVKRFAPSEYGSRKTDDMAWWKGKEEVREYLRKVNENQQVLEYTLFQPGLFLDYLAFPHKTAKYLEPLQTVFNFKDRRAIVVDGYEDAVMTLTPVADAAEAIARAIDHDGRWPVVGGIVGNKVTVSQLLEIGAKVRGACFEVEKVRIQDLEAGELKTSWGLEAVHQAVPKDQAQALLKAVCIGTLLSTCKGAWETTDEINQILPDYNFAPITEFLSKAWRDKA